MLEKIKKKIRLWKKWLLQDFFFIEQIIKTSGSEKRIILLDTANHDNLGDHAIAMAERVFAKEYLPEYGIIEIPGGNILRHTGLYKILIRKTDVLTIAGGGFLGSLWPFEERIVQCILKNFQGNKVVIFPQTFFVEEQDRTFMDLHPGYLNHPNLLICLRDEASYKRMCFLMPTLQDNLMYMPDMVCGLTFNIHNGIRRGIAVCFREDIECVRTKDEQAKLNNILKKLHEPIESISMIENEFVAPRDREKRVNAKLESIASKKLLITDRLHAMLFAALTGTPCIAMNNRSGKVQGGYQWIKDQQYIYFVQCLDQIPEVLQSLELEKDYRYDKTFVENYWEKLAVLIKGDRNE